MKKKLRCYIAMLLTFVMIFNTAPVSAITTFAATTGQTDYLFFGTDRHGNTDIIGKLLTNMERDIGDGALDYVGLGGDMVDNTKSYNSSTVLNEVTAVADHMNAKNVDLIYAAHDEGCTDDAGIMNKSSELLYTADNCYVYGVIESDVKTASSAKTAAEAFVTWANSLGEDDDKAIIVLSHYPLHAKRGDNAGAGYWHNALNTVATGSATGTTVTKNVTFLHGHNHTVDTTEYFYNVGEKVSIESYVSTSDVSTAASANGTSATIYYTYATAGYLTESRGNGQAMLITVDDKNVTYTKYASNEENILATVERVVKESDSSSEGSTDTSEEGSEETTTEETTEAPESTTEATTENQEETTEAPVEAELTGIEVISVPTKVKYFVNDSFDTTGLVVNALYSDGTSKELEWNADSQGDDGYTLDGFNMYTAGEYAVTVTYGGFTDTFDIYVYNQTIVNGDSNVKVTMTVPGVTAISVVNNSDNEEIKTAVAGYVTNYVSYDITLTGYNTGEEVTVTLPIPEGVSNPAVYHVSVDDGVERINDITVNNDGTVSFVATHFSTYLVGEADYPEVKTETVEGNEITGTQDAEYGIDITVDDTVTKAYTVNKVTDETTLQLGTVFNTTVDGQEQSTGGTYTWAVYNSKGVATVDNTGLVTFTGEEGTEIIYVSYEWEENGESYKVSNYIELTTTIPEYQIDIIEKENSESITDTIVIKGIENGDTYDFWASLTDEDGDTYTIKTAKLTWSSNATSIATVKDGKVTFTGKEGTVAITVYYEYANGKSCTNTVTFSVTPSQYVLPSDGTNDFPEYPNQGAIRIDKTATAVGNFSQTGIAQVELSMTGVPYTTGSEIDVVLMLDMTGSMTDTDDRIPATEAAAKVFVESIVKNEDGTYNDNRVAVYTFNSSSDSPYTIIGLGTISSDTELEAAKTAIDGASDTQKKGGTPYASALGKCYDVLNDAKEDGVGTDRSQYCVFMTDGCPTTYQYSSSAYYSSASNIQGMFKTTTSTYDTRDSDYYYEYYSTQMKANEVTVYSVGLGLNNTNSAWKSVSATGCLNAASILLNDISGPAKEETQDTGTALSKKDSYFFSIDDADAATEMENVFSGIALSIKQAATNVVVEDMIATEYSMNFGLPSGVTKDETGMDEFYIQVVDYTLDSSTHERTDTYSVLENFTFNSDGTLKSHTIGGNACGDNCTHVTTTNGVITEIEGTYFTYYIDEKGNEMLKWTAEKLATTELALQYFLYLENSAGVDPEDAVDAGTYADAVELDVNVRASSYMYPPVRINGEHFGCGNRLSATEAARCSVEWDVLRFNEEEFAIRAENTQKLVNVEKDGCPVEIGEGISCRAGSTSFWMTWDGKMLPCGMMTTPVVYPLEVGFDAAWEQLRAETGKIRMPSECVNCSHKELCGVCAAVCYTETGRFDGVPEYVCEKTREQVRITQEVYQERIEK